MRITRNVWIASAVLLSASVQAREIEMTTDAPESEVLEAQLLEDLQKSDEDALNLANYDFNVATESFSLRNLPVGATTVENGKVYSIVSRFSGKCWDIVDHSLNEGAPVQQWDCHGQNNQRFLATLTYKSGFIITPLESNIRLQIANNDPNNGARLIQASYAAGNNGFFFIRPKATPGIFTITANHSSKCLDVVDVNPRNGARIQQWDCHGKSNQDWILIPRP